MVISENRKAIIWSGIEKVGTYVVNFAIQILLARLLCPNDYAVVAMLAIFFSISQAFIDSGFATTLIQKQDCTQTDYSSVFYFNMLVGGVVYLLFFFGAPFIELFYNFEGLALVTRVYSLNLFINSFAMVHRVILTKELRFKKIALITFLSSIVSAIPAIIMAYFGYGYWALVGQSLMSAVVTSALLVYQSKWCPSLIFSRNSLAKLAPFGLKMLVVYLFHAIYNNVYSLLIGKKFPAQELGYYDRGKTLSSMGSVGFSDFYTRALYPIQAKVQNDTPTLRQSYNKSFSVMCLGIVPIAAFMFFFAEETVYSLFGEQWMNCYMLIAEVIKKIMGITCVLVLINFDLKLVVIGWTCCSIVEFLISEGFFLKLYRFSPSITIKTLVVTVAGTFVLSFALSIATTLLFDNMFVRFIVGGIGFMAIYGLSNFRKIKRLI